MLLTNTARAKTDKDGNVNNFFLILSIENSKLSDSSFYSPFSN